MRKTHLYLGVFFLLLITGCIQLKQNTLFINMNETSERAFFAADVIYSDALSSEAWNTKARGCISVVNSKIAAYKGSAGLHVTWNRQGQGCPWLGIGFGWDNWTGKDLSKIKNIGAITFYVRNVQGERSNLPWAIGLEDFTGRQAWLGMNTAAIKGENIGTEWVQIELPLSEFNWHEQGANPANIKQIIFNLEADGEIYMDEIRIAPYHGGFRKRYRMSQPLTIDSLPVFSELYISDKMMVSNHEFAMSVIGSHLHIYGKLDQLPIDLQSAKQNFDVEIAFSTDRNANPRRPRMLSSDQHLGIRLGDVPQIFDIRKGKAMSGVESSLLITNKTTEFEVKLPLESLGTAKKFSIGALYALEIAVHSFHNGEKKRELWNDNANQDFSSNPARWGEFLILENK
jgi:hypothetical protein